MAKTPIAKFDAASGQKIVEAVRRVLSESTDLTGGRGHMPVGQARRWKVVELLEQADADNAYYYRPQIAGSGGSLSDNPNDPLYGSGDGFDSMDDATFEGLDDEGLDTIDAPICYGLDLSVDQSSFPIRFEHRTAPLYVPVFYVADGVDKLVPFFFFNEPQCPYTEDDSVIYVRGMRGDGQPICLTFGTGCDPTGS